MIKPLHIWEDLFKFNFYVLRGVSPEIFKKQLIKYFHVELDVDLKNTVGYSLITTYKKAQGIWVWTRTKAVDNLSHEIEHAVFDAIDSIPMKHTEDTDEVFAYLTGYLMKRILKEGK